MTEMTILELKFAVYPEAYSKNCFTVEYLFIVFSSLNIKRPKLMILVLWNISRDHYTAYF